MVIMQHIPAAKLLTCVPGSYVKPNTFVKYLSLKYFSCSGLKMDLITNISKFIIFTCCQQTAMIYPRIQTRRLGKQIGKKSLFRANLGSKTNKFLQFQSISTLHSLQQCIPLPIHLSCYQ